MLVQLQDQIDPERISPILAISGLVNGMIGSVILVLPIMALNAGYISTLFIIIVTGIFSYFSCYLYLEHLGDQPDNGYSFQKHFGSNKIINKVYDAIAIFFLLMIDIQYFHLMTDQWNRLLPQLHPWIINPLINVMILVIFLMIVKYKSIGASLMAYGIVSIVAYMVFLIWVVVTGDQGYDDQQYYAFGDVNNVVQLAAAMAQGYQIQVFLVPILRKNDNQSKFSTYALIIYVIGGLIYAYVAYMGAIGTRKFIQASGTEAIPRFPKIMLRLLTILVKPTGKPRPLRLYTSSICTQLTPNFC